MKKKLDGNIILYMSSDSQIQIIKTIKFELITINT